MDVLRAYYSWFRLCSADNKNRLYLNNKHRQHYRSIIIIRPSLLAAAIFVEKQNTPILF